MLPLWVLLSATLGLAACSSSNDSRAHLDPISTAGIVLQGDASAAELDTFLHHKPRDWAWAGGQFDAPDDHAALARGTPLTFSWHADPADFAESGSNATAAAVMTHLLEFRTPNHGELLQVFTKRSEYTPDAAAWQKLVDAGEPIALSLTTASFVGSDLPEDGGPFIGQSLTFTIE